jgi:hypothetical protein
VSKRIAAAPAVFVAAFTMLSGTVATAPAQPGDDASTPTPTTTSASRPNQVIGSLILDPDHGAPGIQVTATATNFSPCLRIAQLLWDGDILGSAKFSVVDFDSGTIALSFAVPVHVTTDAHTVQAVCAHRNDASTDAAVALTTTPPATFTVDPPEKPTLTVHPDQGSAGSRITASGTGFSCGTDGVQLVWDDGPVLADQLPGAFTQHVSVPANASVDSDHSITASCTDHPDTAVSQPFTVTPAAISASVTPGDTPSATGPTVSTSSTVSRPSKPPTRPGGPPWWLITLIVAAVITGATYVYRRSRSRPAHAGADVRAVARFDPTPTVTVRETQAPGDVALAIGLVPHPDPGAQTFVEVSS